jgi:hypothetical protein
MSKAWTGAGRWTVTALLAAGLLVGCGGEDPRDDGDGDGEKGDGNAPARIGGVEGDGQASTPDGEGSGGTGRQNGAANDGGNAAMVQVDIELPEPQFKGTPRPADVENLETPRKGPRPPLLAPKGTTNLARGKDVSWSVGFVIFGESEMITDGDKKTGDGHFVDLGPGQQWVQIDLEETCEIYGIVVWHYHAQPMVVHDVIVQVSDDPDFIEDVRTVFNNDHDNSSGMGAGEDKNYVETAEGKLIRAGGVKGRYVRLYSNENSSNESNFYIEVEVFGRPVK